MNISNVISLLGGVALFLFGMNLMGDGLKKVAGNKMELVLYRLSSTSLKGILLGTAVTCIIQSSSATSVMVVGFVNSAMMNLSQAISVIMGSILGTSITGWIIALSELGTGASGWTSLFSTASLTGIIAVVGIIIRMRAKTQAKKHLSGILLGFAVLMYGISSMGTAVAPLKESEAFVSLMTHFSNPILGILAGAVITAILQSASSAVGLLQTLAITGAIDFSIGFPILLGMNIGAAVPVLISSVGAKTEAKRAAFSYLLISLFGSLAVAIIYYAIRLFTVIPFENTVLDAVSIALVNTVFRFISIVILYPFIKSMEKLLAKLIPDKNSGEENNIIQLEDRFLDNPAVALENCKEAIKSMADITSKNIHRANSLIFNYKESEFDKIEAGEDAIDRYEDKLGAYLMKITSHTLVDKESAAVSKYLRSITDLERLGDHSCNIAECAKEIYEKKIEFSPEGRKELETLIKACQDVLKMALDSFFDDDLEEANKVEPLEELIDNLCKLMKSNHIERLRKGVCTIENGFVFNDLLNNFERISDHSSNIALSVIEFCSNEDYTPHLYIENLKINNNSFEAMYDKYAKKYSITEEASE